MAESSRPAQRVITLEYRAFTLVELLAVAVIVALCIGLVAPSLEVARARSKQSVCLGRLGAIGEATAVYTANDPTGLALPLHPLWTHQDQQDPSWIGAYEWGGKSGVGGPLAAPGPSGYWEFLRSKYGTRNGFGPATRPLNHILYPHGFADALNTPMGFDRLGAEKDTHVRLDAYQCPADDGAPGGGHCAAWLETPERSSYDHFGTSYAANKFMISEVGGGEIYSNSPFLRPATRVLAPARTINYEENIGRWAWNCRREKSDCLALTGMEGLDPGPTKTIRGWHGKSWRFTRVFLDAHAQAQEVFIEGSGDSLGYFEHYRTELVFPDDPVKQANSVCNIVRGDGWQKDTLPDEPIPTGLWWDGVGRVSNDGCVEE